MVRKSSTDTHTYSFMLSLYNCIFVSLCSSKTMLIYTETNWGTHFVISISPDSTPKDVKGELERAHVNCFPELGAIRVKALMVNRNSCLYHLSESLPLGYVSEGSTGTLFLEVEPHISVVNDQLDLPESVSAKSSKRDSEGNRDTNFTQLENLGLIINGRKIEGVKKMRRIKQYVSPKFTFLEIWRVANILKRKRQRNPQKDSKSISCHNRRFSRRKDASRKTLDLFYSNSDYKWNEGLLSSPVLESPSMTLLESVSVSGIIKKYFSVYDEVASSYDNSPPTMANYKDQCHERQDSRSLSKHRPTLASPVVKPTPKMLPTSSPDEPSHGSSIMQHKKPNVGNRLILASGTLAPSACKRPSSLPFSKCREVSMQPKSATCVRSLVFEMSDTDR